ncbi:MAG: sulfatase/phosphatase domain-containing protein, partial [Candidatus Aminicenantales bacterium]
LVSLVDILPTGCEMAGLSLPPQTQGSSLVPLFFGKGKPTKRFAYSETYYPRFHFGWSELKGVQDERFKLILAPQIELYDLIEDPEETKNLAESHPSETRRLVALAEKFIQESGKNAMAQSFHQVDEETRQRLAALGYIGSFIDDRNLEGKKLANPREKIHVFNELSRANPKRPSGSSNASSPKTPISWTPISRSGTSTSKTASIRRPSQISRKPSAASRMRRSL